MVSSITPPPRPSLFLPPYRYVIDSCSIISQKPDEPHRRTVYSTMWRKIEELIREQVIVTCSEVREEIKDGELQHWLVQHHCVILDIDEIVQRLVSEIVNDHPKLIDFTNGKSSADAFLIATAMKYRLSVITEERKESTKKIPAICKAYGINCYNLTELADREGWRF